MKYIIATLGCKVNQYETQAMETLLRAKGHEPAAEGEQAGLVIVNTCAVTAESGRKSRQLIRRLRDENPEAALAVCGCYSQLSPESARELGAKVIYGAALRQKFVEAAERAALEGVGEENVDAPFKRRDFECLPAGAVSGRTRAMLKIQDGCVNFCSYCIIPYTRGRLRSLPLEEAARQSRELAAQGYRELVLTGIEVASYGVDLPGKPGLADIVETVSESCGDMRLRLGSLEPTVIDEDFCRRLAATGKLCRHFHLSLQSGCDVTLKAMNRKYDTARFFEAVQLLRKYFPGCALTGDLICGFPGESEADHAQTLEFIEKCGFAEMHIFPYSRRPGTPADKDPRQLTNAVKSRRTKQAQQVAERSRLAYMQQALGTVLPVLFESGDESFSVGHSDSYLPVKVNVPGLRGKMGNVTIRSIAEGMLIGEIIEI